MEKLRPIQEQDSFIVPIFLSCPDIKACRI